MKSLRASAAVLLAGLWLPALCGCTKNPFGEGDITSGSRQLRGTVQITSSATSDGAYVWLEGFNLGTYTDASGRFELTLPPSSSQGSSGGVSGVFNLYFYLANFRLASAEVVTRDGAFVYSSGDINRNGELNDTKVLQKVLRISTRVEPASVPASYVGSISVQVTLTATVDSVTVVFPRSVDGALGAVLVKRIGSAEAYVYQSTPNASSREVVVVGRFGHTRGMAFNLITAPLLPAEYEVIPYLLLRHEVIPEGLMAGLGNNVEELGPNYLKIPCRREGGQLTVTR